MVTKKNWFRVRVLIYLVALICLTSGSTLGKQEQIVISLVDFDFQVENVNGQADFKDAILSGDSGSPNLPVKNFSILLPPDTKLDTVEAILENPTYKVLPGIWEVLPAPPLAISNTDKLFWPEGSQIVNGYNINVYKKNEYFPSMNIGQVNAGQERKWCLADVQVFPYQYNPVTKSLRRLASGQLKLSYTRGAADKSTRLSDDSLSELLRTDISKRVVNYEKMEREYKLVFPPLRRMPYYAIITTEAIRDNSKQLANFVTAKRNMGFAVGVITETTWGGGTGDIAAERIRSWLMRNYVLRNIQYVLLIGNPHPENGDVPMKMCYPRSHSDTYREAPTDLYYADLTGDWDINGNGLYGEFLDFVPGGADLKFEVVVGRIPYYESISDLDSILKKTVRYGYILKKYPQWRKNCLLPMKPSDSATPGYHLGESIMSNTLIPSRFNFHRVYDSDYGLPTPPETTPCSLLNVTNAWTDSSFGTVFWWTHGSATSASNIMNTATTSSLDNNCPVFTFQASCTNSYPELSNNLSYSLLKNGSIVSVGATRVSWYYPGQINYNDSPTNSGMTYEYGKNLIKFRLPSGRALQTLKTEINPERNEFWMNYLVFMLYGDPSLGLFNYKSVYNGIPVLHEKSKNVKASSVYNNSGDYQPWKAFDGDDLNGTRTFWLSQSGMPQWLAYNFENPVKISMYYILPQAGKLASRAPKEWELQGSNDGIKWTTIDTQQNITLDMWSSDVGLYFSIAKPDYYSMYRLYVKTNNGNVLASICQLKLILQDNIVPAMTSYNLPAGEASASGSLNKITAAWKAFDRDDESSDDSCWVSNSTEEAKWIAYDFKTSTEIRGYYILPLIDRSARRAPKNWRLEGWSNILRRWITIDTQTNITPDRWNGDGIYFGLKAPVSYGKYRLYITDTNGESIVSIRQLKFYK